MNFNINSGWGPYHLGSVPPRITGKIFLVAKSGVANRNIASDLFRDDPEGDAKIFATLDAAVSACTANAGDLIYVAPGHTESISSATALVLDVAGVKIIGLGEESTRGTLTLNTATTATIIVSANDVTIENLNIDLTGINAVDVGFTVSGNNFTLKDCLITTANLTSQCVLPMSIGLRANHPVILNCEFMGTVDNRNFTGTTTVIRFNGSDRPVIKNSIFVGAYLAATGAIEMVRGVPCTNINFENNFFYNKTIDSTTCIVGSPYITSAMGITGILRNNLLRINLDGSGSWLLNIDSQSVFGFGNCALIQNYGVNASGENGVVLGKTSYWGG